MEKFKGRERWLELPKDDDWRFRLVPCWVFITPPILFSFNCHYHAFLFVFHVFFYSKYTIYIYPDSLLLFFLFVVRPN